jgi:hypothetical protein
VILANGSGFTTTEVGAEVEAHPFELVTVTVMSCVVVTVIDCVVAPVLHKYEVPVLAVNTTEPPWQKVVEPLAVITADGSEFTVKFVDTVLVQPFAFVYVYVKVVVPGLTPVTTPVVALIAATVLFAVDHKPPACALLITAVLPSQTVVAPALAARTGSGLTVTFVAAEVAEQPLLVVIVTAYAPVAFATYVLEVAPVIAAPFNLH